MNQDLTLKYKNTLQILIILLVGIILLIIGLIGYVLSKEVSYFYLVALANILVIYVIIKSQIKKHHVIYDAVFIKYKLDEGPTKRLKVDEICGVEQNEKSLFVKLNEENMATINLTNYSSSSITEFKQLLEKMAAFKC